MCPVRVGYKRDSLTLVEGWKRGSTDWFGDLGKDWVTFAEKTVAPHSSTLAWKISWTEEPGRLQSMGSLRVGHD